ncbi:MAG: endonuclease domain-containing protein [Chitinivibrionales bacterium]|nr:endonuclease domain-containing protein [Chitinivibrionales bacterium]
MDKNFKRHKNTPKYITGLARKNRLNPTIQEEKLWVAISGKKLNNMKFRRQFPIGRYIADFYNHAHRLIIEIDGNIHEIKKEYDGNRDNYLRGCGYRVLRFANSEIEMRIEMVLQKIAEYLKVPLRGI